MTARRRSLAVAVLLAASAGCGDDGVPPEAARCDLAHLDNYEYYRILGCAPGLLLALRYSNELLLQQSEWDEYYRIITAVYRAEPLTTLAGPAAVAGWPGEAFIQTTYPPIVEAWSQGRIRTGDASVDGIFADTAERVEDLGGWFRVLFPRPISVDVLVHQLEAAALPDTIGPEIFRRLDDVRVTWNGDLAQLVLIGGWGDCWTGCAWFHYWSATVDPNNVVQVWDLGGDPIPEWLAEAARAFVSQAPE